jgi:hydrogenase maturation protease
MKILILGLGNDIRNEDAVGIIVAKKLYEKVKSEDVFFEECSLAGFRIFDIIVGYDKVIIIDTIPENQDLKFGECYKICNKEEDSKFNLYSSHNFSLFNSIKLAKDLGLNVPKDISIYAVAVKKLDEFGEGISEEIKQKIPHIVEEIYREEFENA